MHEEYLGKRIKRGLFKTAQGKISNPKCFRKWDRGFGSEPNSFNYKEIIYYVISYSAKPFFVGSSPTPDSNFFLL